MTPRSLIIAPLCALVLAAVGCGGGAGSASGGDNPATIVPASAPVYAVIDTDTGSDQWQKAEQLLNRFPDHAKLVASFQKSIRESNISWQDLESSVGDDVAVVWLDFANGGEDVVGITKPKDEAKFQQVLKSSDKPAVSTKVDGWTVFSDKQALLDRFKQASAGDKLAEDATFTDAMSGLEDEALVKAYANGARVATALRGALASAGAGLGLGQLDKLQWLAAAAVAQDDGVRVDVRTKTNGRPAKPFKAAFLQQIPSGALAYVGFHGSANAFAQLRSNAQVQAFLPQIEKMLGVKLADLEPLFAGEGALYVRQGAPIPEITLLLSPKDTTKAVATLDKLSRIARFAGGKGPTPAAGGLKKIEFPNFALYYGAVDGKVIVTDSGQALAALHGGGKPLADDPLFTAAKDAAGMPDATTGTLYVNLKDAVPLVENFAQLAGASIPDEVARNLEPLRTLLAYGAIDGDVTRATVLLQVSK